jgi:hypothetical protein
MATTKTESRRGRTPGFKGTRNTDTSAAVAARKAKARERRIQAAETLLIAEGYEITPPTATGT